MADDEDRIESETDDTELISAEEIEESREDDAHDAQAAAQAPMHNECTHLDAAREEILCRLLALSPGDLSAYSELESLYVADGRFTELCELLAQKLDHLDSARERTALMREIASLLRERFDDDDRAFEVLLDAFREDFTDDESARDLESLARWNDRWGDLLVAANDWMREPSVLADPRNHVALLLRIAKWYGEDLDKPAWALAYLEEARAIAPFDVRVFRGLAQMYEKNGSIDASEPHLRRVLELDPSDEVAIVALDKILSARGDAYELIGMLERVVRGRQDPALNPTRVRLAELHRQVRGGEARSTELLILAYEIDRSDPRVLGALAEDCQRTGSWPLFAEVLERAIEVAETEADRVQLLYCLAEAIETQFLDPDLAARRLEQLLEIDAKREDAYRAVARCYCKLRLWDAAVHAYERWVDAIEDVPSRIEATFGIARITEIELADSDRAIEAYQAILDFDPCHHVALDAIARLFDARGDVASALATMARLCDRASDPAQKVIALCRLAAAHDEKMGDVVAARGLYREVLEIEPGCIAALSALRRYALDIDDAREAIHLLDREQRHTSTARARAKLLAELARLRRDRLGDERGALHAFQEAHALDPDNEEAALPLAESYTERCEWNLAEPILDRLIKTVSKRARGEQQRIFALHGHTLAALGETRCALEAYGRALALDPSDAEVIRGLAEAAFACSEWKRALSAQQKLLAFLGEEDDGARADALCRLGVVQHRLGDTRKAISSFERALEVCGDHRASLRALADLHAENQAWTTAVGYERKLADLTPDEETRRSLLRGIASVYAEKASDVPKAIETLEEALAIDPTDRRVLHQLLRHRESVSDFAGVCAVIEKLVEIDDDDARKAKYLVAAGNIHREQRKDAEAAVSCFDRALDADPKLLEAFEAIDATLTATRDWAHLERCYRKMIHRARCIADTKVEFMLWHGLGVIFRDRLVDPDASVECFRMASRLRPDDSQERRIIAEIYQASDRSDLAIAELRSAIDRDPLAVEPYRALYALHVRTGQLDQAWCVAAALVFLKGADRDTRECHQELRPKGVPAFRARLSGETWREIFHPEQDQTIGAVFATVARAARAARLHQLQAQRRLPRLAPELKQESATATTILAKAYFGAANVLSFDPPTLYVRPDMTTPSVTVPSDPPATVLSAPAYVGWSITELMFHFGKGLTSQQGQHAVKTLYPSLSELTTLLHASISIAMPQYSPYLTLGRGCADSHGTMPPEANNMVRETARMLRQELRSDELDGLGRAVATFVDSGNAMDVRRWVQCSELTAVRAGLVLSGDPGAAAKIIRQEPLVAGDLPPTEKVKELLRFLVSEAHSTVRRALGVDARGVAPTSAPSVVKAPQVAAPLSEEEWDDDEPTRDRKLCA